MHPPESLSTERLAAHIELLHEGFARLSRAATLKDLARQFADIAKDDSIEELHLFHRPGQAKDWEKLFGNGTENFGAGANIPLEKRFSIIPLDDSSTRVCVIQSLIDGSNLGMLFGRKVDGTPYSEIDRVHLQLKAQLFDNAHQALLRRRTEKDLIFSLNHRVLQLNSLIGTGIEVSRLEQSTSLQRLALERAASLTNASRGVVRIAAGEKLKEEVFFPVGMPATKNETPGFHITSSFQFAGDTYTFELFDKESRSGTVPFDETDQLLLDALARQVHASLENRYLHKQALEKQKIDQDIAVAASIQKKILPESLPAIEGYDIFGINIPSKSVGGDYYDCIPIGDGRYALTVADVSGKGVPAALLVSSFHAYLGGYLEGRMPIVQLAQKLNNAIYRASTDDKFITAFFAVLTPATGELESLSAGHNPVYLLRKNNTVEELSAGGLALGMMEIDFPYETNRVVLEKGDRLLLYTDGVTEAVNEKLELYDADHPLKEFVARTKPPAAKEFIQSLIVDIKEFSGSAPQADDITAMYLVRK